MLKPLSLLESGNFKWRYGTSKREKIKKTPCIFALVNTIKWFFWKWPFSDKSDKGINRRKIQFYCCLLEQDTSKFIDPELAILRFIFQFQGFRGGEGGSENILEKFCSNLYVKDIMYCIPQMVQKILHFQALYAYYEWMV